MKAKILVLLLLLLPCLAGASPSFEELKKEYLSLRNTDVKIERLEDWKALARKLEVFADNNPENLSDAPAALLYSSILRMEAGKAKADTALVSEARAGLEALASRFPRSDLADDALLLLGSLSEEGVADSYYQKLIERYPASDSAEIARARLARMQDMPEAQEPASRTREANSEGRLIILDPGHGGEDRGAVGGENLFEKDVALMVAISASELLESQGYPVELTREDDSFVPLSERTSFANAEGGALFVSLHVNASIGGKRSGLETYILDISTDHAARLLAERENVGSGGSGPDDVQVIVSDLVQKGKSKDSERLAHSIQTSIITTLKAGRQSLPDNGIRKAPFYVLVGAHMPCVLVEMGYIDNEREGGLLAEASFRDTLARGLSQGIVHYLESAK